MGISFGEVFVSGRDVGRRAIDIGEGLMETEADRLGSMKSEAFILSSLDTPGLLGIPELTEPVGRLCAV